MKRYIAGSLIFIMLMLTAAPAFAEDDMQDDLTKIAEHVISVLDIDDGYTDFSGDYGEDIVPAWYLYWSKDGESVSVNCTEGGTITNIYYGRYEYDSDHFYGYDAAFSALSQDEALKQAQYWLDRLMPEGETARIDRTVCPVTKKGSYSFSGVILYKGLETPVSFSLDLGQKGITSYYRYCSLEGYAGGIPSEVPEISEQEASEKLFDTIEMEIYYVKDVKTAYLRYVPVDRKMAVDAMTGDVIDIDALYKDQRVLSLNKFGIYGAAEESAADTGAGRELTEVELKSIENYADAKSKDDLDSTIRSINMLGLDDFSLDRCTYSMGQDGEISAELRYSCEINEDRLFGYSKDSYLMSREFGDKPLIFKYINVDAKTGSLINVYTYCDLWEKEESKAADEDAAYSFIRNVASEMAEDSSLCTLSGYEDGTGLTFARTHDGYFFPENYLYVEMNPATGAVDTYYYNWDEDVVFGSSEDPVSMEDAAAAYAEELDVDLCFTAYPVEVSYDDPVLYKYADWGYSYIESLILAYCYGGKDEISGVDALTGECIKPDTAGGFTYDDLEETGQTELILRLAEAGIGFSEGSFLPEKTLTLRDAGRLLVKSAAWFDPDPSDEALKSEMTMLGFIKASEWEPDKDITVSEFIHMIIGASRYGYSAEIEDLWEGEDGYLAISKALGMLDEEKDPGSICTRLDAAEILYAFMER